MLIEEEKKKVPSSQSVLSPPEDRVQLYDLNYKKNDDGELDQSSSSSSEPEEHLELSGSEEEVGVVKGDFREDSCSLIMSAVEEDLGDGEVLGSKAGVQEEGLAQVDFQFQNHKMLQNSQSHALIHGNVMAKGPEISYTIVNENSASVLGAHVDYKKPMAEQVYFRESDLNFNESTIKDSLNRNNTAQQLMQNDLSQDQLLNSGTDNLTISQRFLERQQSRQQKMVYQNHDTTCLQLLDKSQQSFVTQEIEYEQSANIINAEEEGDGAQLEGGETKQNDKSRNCEQLQVLQSEDLTKGTQLAR